MKNAMLMKRLFINKQIYKEIKYQIAIKNNRKFKLWKWHNLEHSSIFTY